MRIGSLFSGIGGLELGLELAGVGDTIWQVEIDPFCRSVLERHWPNSHRYTDIRDVTGLPAVDLICGGFPCQDVSAAGKGAGIKAGTRSGLWFEFRRIVDEVKPKFVVVENVASGKKRWLPQVRRDLHVLGYGTRAFALSAFDVGAPHLRRRVFVLATNTNGKQLRVEPGGRGWSNGKGSGESEHDGPERSAPDPDRKGKSQQEGRVAYQWRRDSDGGGWTIEPPICGVAHGVSRRMDRNKALGNAVHVECARVIGRIICSI